MHDSYYTLEVSSIYMYLPEFGPKSIQYGHLNYWTPLLWLLWYGIVTYITEHKTLKMSKDNFNGSYNTCKGSQANTVKN